MFCERSTLHGSLVKHNNTTRTRAQHTHKILRTLTEQPQKRAALPDLIIQVNGHCDKLSIQRHQASALFMIEHHCHDIYDAFAAIARKTIDRTLCTPCSKMYVITRL